MDVLKAARKRVDDLNRAHYKLLEQRDGVNGQIRDNAAELADAVDALTAAEQAAAATARADSLDLADAAAPADPPATATVVDLGQARDSSKARRS